MNIFDQRVQFAELGRFQIPAIVVPVETEELVLTINRDALWLPTSTIKVELGLTVNGSPMRASGQATGGARVAQDGNVIPYYQMRYHPTKRFTDGALRRMARTGDSTTCFVRLTSLSGAADIHLTVEANP
jgi:hypothetical protein